LNVHRRIERQWAERVKALSQIRSRFVVATTRTLQQVLNNNDGSLIPVAIAVDQRRFDWPRSHDQFPKS
jgi:hypothetical protein